MCTHNQRSGRKGFNSLKHDKILDFSKLKALADDKNKFI